MKPILIIQTGDISLESPFYYKKKGGYYEIFTRTGCLDGLPVEVVKVSEGERLPSYSNISGVIITGSDVLISQKLKWSEACAKWIQSTIPTGIPILGICYGHQLIAHALGGIVGKNPNGPELGSVEIKLLPKAMGDPLFKEVYRPLYLQSFHFETVTKLPDGAISLAKNKSGEVEAIKYTSSCWGVQFHPEFDNEDMRLFLTDLDIETIGVDIDRSIKQLQQTPFGPTLLKNFSKLVAGGEISS